MLNSKLLFVMICGLSCGIAFNRTCKNCIAAKNKKQAGCDSNFTSGCTTSDLNYVEGALENFSDDSYYGLGGDQFNAIGSRTSNYNRNPNTCYYNPSRPSYRTLYNDWLLNLRRLNRFTSCDRLYENGMRTNGPYNITIQGVQIQAYCEFQLNQHNWVVFQRRSNGGVDFYRSWAEYRGGFGNVAGEFWIGLDALHLLTRYFRQPVLRIDLEDFQGNTAYAEYRSFTVEGPLTQYRLWVGCYSGNAGDSLAYHSGSFFSTRDRDNDCHYLGRNCAVEYHGAWWYNSCAYSNLNGMYFTGSMVVNRTGVGWFHWKQNFLSLRTVSMKLRSALYIPLQMIP